MATNYYELIIQMTLDEEEFACILKNLKKWDKKVKHEF